MDTKHHNGIIEEGPVVINGYGGAIEPEDLNDSDIPGTGEECTVCGGARVFDTEEVWRNDCTCPDGPTYDYSPLTLGL